MARLDGLRVLLVEDAADVREVMKRLLEIEGAEVVATETGREAIDLARQGSFAVLLTDLGLPDVPGDVVIRNAKAHLPRLWLTRPSSYFACPHCGAQNPCPERLIRDYPGRNVTRWCQSYRRLFDVRMPPDTRRAASGD